MEVFHQIIKIIDANVFFCLIPIVISILLIELIFKNRFETKLVINFVRKIIIGYTIVSILFFLFGMIFKPAEFAFFNRATGPYAIFYWILLFGATVVPFSLLYKKIGLKPFYILFVLFVMRFGLYFERFVIIATRFQRNYEPNNNNSDIIPFFIQGTLMIFFQGFIMAIVLLAIFDLIKKNINNKIYSKN